MSNKVILLGTLLIILVGGFVSYEIWGKNPFPKSVSEDLAEISPSPVLVSTTTSLAPSSTPHPTITPKPTSVISPTATPKPTPTITPTPTIVIVTLTQNSTPNLDGFRSSNNGGNNSTEIRVGRNSNLTMRGFVSFEVPAAISGKTISSVFLRLYQYQVTGSPYSVGGNLSIEHMDFGSSLGEEDYSQAVFDANTAVMGASNPTLEWKDIDVTAAFKNDLTNGHSRSQYRLRFTTETVGGDVAGDFAYFYSSNPGSDTHRPQLVIKYYN